MTLQKPQSYVIFMLVRALTPWLALAPSDRFSYVDRVIRPIMAAHPNVRLRFFDSEAFNARISDVMMWESDDLAAYSSLIEALRETLFWDHYFQVVEIMPSIENGFAQHYGVETLGAT
jgi:hypothetical protein